MNKTLDSISSKFITHSLQIINGHEERSFTSEELEIYRFMIGGIIGK